jgi:hypothetical protein
LQGECDAFLRTQLLHVRVGEQWQIKERSRGVEGKGSAWLANDGCVASAAIV